MTEVLSDIAIQRELGALHGWSRRGDVLTRTYQFRNFLESMRFVNRVADAAEAADHHPDIEIHYKRVVLSYSTHSEGGLTEKDFAGAAMADEVAGSLQHLEEFGDG